MMLQRYFAIAALAALGVAGGGAGAKGQALLSDNYSTFNAGNLVGQNGYTQLGTAATSPILVSGGSVVRPPVAAGSAGAADSQDAYKSFTTVAPPTAGTTSVYVGFSLRVNAAQANPSYFFALSDTATGFANERITAKTGTGANTFNFGARVTGQAGYPFVYGGDLSLGQTYNLVAKANLVAGATNDTLQLFVNPTAADLANNTNVYATSAFTSGTAADPTALGIAILSQFASATVGQNGVSFDQLVVSLNAPDVILAPVPEPATVLAASSLAFAGVGALRRRRRQQLAAA